MSYGETIDLGEFKTVLLTKNPSKRKLYTDIFQSFSKRNTYCNIYYTYFKEATTEEKIKIDYRDSDKERERINDWTDYRAYYESATLSFLQNIHALCDSASHAINEIVLDKHRFLKNVYLDSNLLKNVKLEIPGDNRLYNAIKDFIENEDFKKLKAYVNSAKHSHIVKIINYGDYLALESFKNKECEFAQEDLLKFMLRIHDQLLGKIWNIYIIMKDMISTKA